MKLIVRHQVAAALFADMSCDPCILSETTSPNFAPRIVMGKHGDAMLLSPNCVRELLPHLQTFAVTGQMIKPLEEDWSI